MISQIECLIARVVQVVEDNPGAMVEILVTVDGGGTPLCWAVHEIRAEGIPIEKKDLTTSQKQKKSV